jgi:hypothetical protein
MCLVMLIISFPDAKGRLDRSAELRAAPKTSFLGLEGSFTNGPFGEGGATEDRV